MDPQPNGGSIPLDLGWYGPHWGNQELARVPAAYHVNHTLVTLCKCGFWMDPIAPQ